MEEFSSRQVRIDDPFWSARLEMNARRAIFHQWEQLEASGCIDNFRILAGEKEGFREGRFFADSDAYKWLDATARIQTVRPDPMLGMLMDNFLELLQRACAEDGYLYTYNQIHFPGTRWINLQIEHELYCHGHLIEACISHHLATGRSDSLELAQRAADLLVRDFRSEGAECTPGHEEIEIALLRLYQVTNHPDYLELAEKFLNRRGKTHPFALLILRQNASSNKREKHVREARQTYLDAHPEHAAFQLPGRNAAKSSAIFTLRWFAGVLTGKYFQQHKPIQDQDVPVGHSVRFGYLETAATMLQRLQPDAKLRETLEQAWEKTVTRRMYVTGGLGSLPVSEGFGRDYELNPELAYAETCAALAGMFWDWEMVLTSGNARYSDLFEWQLYNASAVGMGLNGESYLYNNPLACRGTVTRQAWFDVPCCPSNLTRTWADLGRYIYSVDDENLWVHQYIGSSVNPETGGFTEVQIESNLPFSGRALITIHPRSQEEFALQLRIPSWSTNSRVHVNGEDVTVPPASTEAEPAAGGYDPRTARFLTIRRAWKEGDRVEMVFDMTITLRKASHRVKGHSGNVAVTRGPLVYCLESIDNPDVDIFTCRLDPSSLRSEAALRLLEGTHVLRGRTIDGQLITFIPYALWANRGRSQMNVWVRT